MTKSGAGTASSSYRCLLVDAGWRRWTLASGLSRLPVAMAPLALVIAGRYATGSFADGALLAGAYALAESIAAPWRGRRLDRGERREGFAFALGGASVALAALLLCTISQAPLPLLLLATVAAAALPSAVQGGMRAFLPELVGERAPLAFTLDASLLEIEWMSAPALVAVLALVELPYLAVAAMLAATVGALMATRLLPRIEAHAERVRGAASPWRNPAAARSYFVSAILGYTEGTITVALAPLLVTLHSRAGFAGLLLVALSIASAGGGLAFAALGPRIPGSREQQANAIAVALGLLSLPVALASSMPMAIVAVAAFGLLIAPLNALRTQLLSEVVPAGQRAEAFSILYAAMGIGWGLSGLAVSMLLSSVGASGAIAVAAGVAVLGGLTAQFIPGAGSIPLRERVPTTMMLSGVSSRLGLRRKHPELPDHQAHSAGSEGRNRADAAPTGEESAPSPPDNSRAISRRGSKIFRRGSSQRARS